VNFAKRASVEWRIVVAKLGLMDARELEGLFCPFILCRERRLIVIR
jgi:hypothetical protein